MKTLALSAALVTTAGADTALTIYNRNLAVVRETVPIELKAGETTLSFDRATAQVIPDSVVLRDPASKVPFSILEQSYRNDPLSRGLLLKHFEGREIEFRTTYPDGRVEVKTGKIIRSGYVPGGGLQDPIIEVEGKLRFQLPGEPVFPALGDDSILRPTLGWQLSSDTATKFDAELSYLSRGFSWQADYNVVAPEKGEIVTLTGWITLNNQCGTAFSGAKVKLVAGDVNIMQPNAPMDAVGSSSRFRLAKDEQKVEEKAFDDFHLYTLPRPLTIRDRETKQVEFLRAPEVKAKKKYVYDAASMRLSGGEAPNQQPMQGMTFPKDVAIYWEFDNRTDNGLGVPLPAGTVRLYRANDDGGNLEFVGENRIDHTPQNEKVSVYTGNAFDLVGERKLTNFQVNSAERWVRETMEVTVKNRSKEPKSIIVREHLWRWSNWNIEKPSQSFEKKDAQMIEFTVSLAPDEEKKVSYVAHYTW